MTDILDVFSDEAPADETEDVEKVETEETEQVESKAETTAAETEETDEGKEAKADESETDQEQGTKEKAYLAQAKDERQKRQKLQAELEEAQAKLTEFQNPEKNKRPDVFEDQEAFAESLSSEFDQKLARTKMDVARDMMKSFYDDYEEVESMVIEEMSQNPVLKSELQKADNVAKAVYDYGKRMQKFNEMKEFDADAYKAKLKAELEAELSKKKPVEDDEPKLTPSLTNARGGTQVAEKLSDNPGDLF